MGSDPSLTRDVRRVRAPLLGDDLEHAGLGRLRRHEEPEGRGQVQPGRGHKVGPVKQDRGVTEQSQREGTVVVIP